MHTNIKKNVALLFFVFFVTNINAQNNVDSIYVIAKIWSRDSNRNIVYSDWKTFPTATIDMLKGVQKKSPSLDMYGGSSLVKGTPTGFFRTQKLNNRWWVIDPLGNAFVVKGVNSIKLGSSPNNKMAFDSIFKTDNNWIYKTYQLLKNIGFNTSGSWSDIDLIRKMNQTENTHFAYTTQLNILSDFAKNKKAINSDFSILTYIFDTAFESFVKSKCENLIAYNKDPNLLGHFSDNELPFQDNLIKKFLAINDKNNAAYLFLKKWMIENKVDQNQYSKTASDQFTAAVAAVYYKLVATHIKKADPNHMYIGSRIHAAVKDNVYFLKEMDRYVDIASINYYGFWNLADKHKKLFSTQLSKPFFITEFYTKGEDAKMGNITGAGWLVKTQTDRGNHYQNFCLHLLSQPNCVGWHWFKYQDNDPEDKLADPSNNDSNKGLVTSKYKVYDDLINKMKQLNQNEFNIIRYYQK